MSVTSPAMVLRGSITSHRTEFDALLIKYRASNPRLFGSVARGDAHQSSDIDLLVDLDMSAGNYLMRLAGLGEELSMLLGVNVDVVDATLLRQPVAATALADAVAL